MHDQDVKKVLESLQKFARLLEKDGLYTEDHQQAFDQVFTLLSKEGLTRSAVDLMPVSLAAVDFLNRVIDTVEQAEDEETTGADLARLRLEMSEIYYTLGDWDEALKRLLEALELGKQADDQTSQAAAYAGIGRVQSRRTVWSEATEALHRALTLYQELQDPEGEARTLLLLGNAAFLLGAYEKARTLLQDALDACTNTPSLDEVTGDIYLTLGVVEQVSGHTDQAIARYEESFSRFKHLGDRRRMAQAYFNLGIVHVEREEWQQAGWHYEQSLVYAQQSGDLGMIGMIYLRRGEMQAKLADSKLSLRYGRRAMEIFEQLQMTSGQADVYRLYGEIATISDTPEDGGIFLAESRRLQQAAGSRLGEAEVAETEAGLHEKEGDRMQATARYHYALAQLQDLGAEGPHTKRIQDALLRLEKRMRQNGAS